MFKFLDIFWPFLAVRPQPSSPFKKPLAVHLKNDNCAILNGTDGSSDSGNSGSSNSGTSHSNCIKQKLNSIQPLQVNNETAFQSGQLPVIADVRSPDVLHNKNGPCDCLSHPIPVIKCWWYKLDEYFNIIINTTEPVIWSNHYYYLYIFSRHWAQKNFTQKWRI